jgi:DedD protein
VKESVKHRLIGAAVLIAAGVLFLPSFIKDRQQYNVDINSQLPARPNIRVVDFNEPVRPEGIDPAKPADDMFAVTEPVNEQEVVNTQTLHTQKSVTSSAAALQSGWVLQVASLSSLEGAKQLRDKLMADGQRAYLRSNATGGHKVLIGPKHSKDELVRIKEQVDKQLNVNSLVIPFVP